MTTTTYTNTNTTNTAKRNNNNNNNNNNDEDFGRKFHEIIIALNAPWPQPPSIKDVDPTNDKQWHDRESSLNGVAYSYINNVLKPKGSALVSEIRNDL